MSAAARWSSEDGFAVPATIGLGGVVLSLGVAGMLGGQVLVAQRRAASSADLAALAGAVAAQHGQDPCAAARRMAVLGPGEVGRCSVEGDRVRVTAKVPLELAGHHLVVRARAVAGPRS